MEKIDKQIMIYESGGKSVKFNFEPEAETLWATQAQIAALFDITPQTVARHLQNIYKDGELEEERTCTFFVQVGDEGGREVARRVKAYNLDAVISVGYRVNSRKATDFRIWATRVLKKYIVKGVAVNEQRLEELSRKQLREVGDVLDVVRRIVKQNDFAEDEAQGILEVLAEYRQTFRVLREYDNGYVRIKGEGKAKRMLEAGECVEMIDRLREAMGESEMFGKLRGDEFEGILRAVYQSFGGEELYPTVAEKAANLLYFIIKDHPFFDGNKRIAAMLFVVFLTVNKAQLTEKGEAKISNAALTALTLMIAESEPRERGLLTAVVCRVLE